MWKYIMLSKEEMLSMTWIEQRITRIRFNKLGKKAR